MSIVRKLAAPLVPAQRLQAAIPPADTLSTLDAFYGSNTIAGQRVTYDRALSLTAVYACIRILADAVGAMSLISWRDSSTGRAPARDLPAYRLLRDEPNPEMTAADCWGTVIAHLNLDGNAFLGKAFDNAGRLAALWPIQPDRVRVARLRGQIVFYVRDQTGVERPTPYTPAEIVHVKGLSVDGIRGMSPIGLAREAIGAGLAMDEYSNGHWQRGAMPSAIVTAEKELEPAAATRLQRKLQRLYGGSRNRGRIVVLEEKLQWEQVSLSAQDTGFLDQHRIGVEQIARIYRVPLSKLQAIASGDSMTYRNLQMDQLQFYTDSVMPWAIRIEQALRRDPDIFPRLDEYPEFDPANLLRADAKTRAEINRIALGGRAWALPSDVRPGEGLPLDPRLDEMALAAGQDIGLLASRMGLAASYGVLSPEESRTVIADAGVDINPADVPDQASR